MPHDAIAAMIGADRRNGAPETGEALAFEADQRPHKHPYFRARSDVATLQMHESHLRYARAHPHRPRTFDQIDEAMSMVGKSEGKPLLLTAKMVEKLDRIA